ncbi:MAG: hypothetical protein DMG39_29140 [Acidobacteria bacterium]|nr:MAG: hypothetical protein DMG39_29140 [Acidobacteriota bacterium]
MADEVVLLVNPVLLGKGKRLFAEGTPPPSFALDSTQALPSGIVINTYKLRFDRTAHPKSYRSVR